jgi:Fe-S-cluster containining protein
MDQNKLWTELLEELALQRQCLDMMNAGWIGEYSSRGGVIYCGRGCHSCCSLAVNCTLTEAVALAGVLEEARLVAVGAYARRLRELVGTVFDMKGYLQMQRRDMGMCPLLADDGSCSAYDPRPLSCRSLLSTKESYWCGVDFTTVPAVEKEQYVASLDRSVTAFPLHYVASAQETGREFEERQLAHMQKLFGFSCYGCMPVLVTLVHEHALAEASSREQAERLAEAAGFSSPLLVSWLP